MVIKIRYKYIIYAVLPIIIISMFFMATHNQKNKIKAVSPDNGSVYVPIIMYHEIKTYKLGKDVISPYEFESDLKYLSNNNYHTITMKELIDYTYNGAELPENPIVLSFDDGYLNTYEHAYPLLLKYKMKMVFSIIGKSTDDFTEIPDDHLDYSHVTWNQLKEMVDSGYVEVQNHTYNLHSISNARLGCTQKRDESFSTYEQTLIDDINKLQNKIALFTGVTPNAFTYPYGKSCDNAAAIIKKLGFKATLSCDYGINKITDDPECLYGLKRICRSHGDILEKVLSSFNPHSPHGE